MPDVKGAHLMFLTEHFGVKLNFLARHERWKYISSTLFS